MKKIKIFLASSNELKPEREKFEIEIYRKCKTWFDKGVFLHLDIWEDMSARMSMTGSQSEYNKFVKEADLFVFLDFYANFNDGNDLWNQFNKELDRLEADGFTENKRPEKNSGTTNITQTADKIYNIDKIDTANFS